MDEKELEAVAARFFRAVEDGDEQALNDVYDDQMSIWHSHRDGEMNKTENIAELIGLSCFGVRIRYFPDEQLVVGNRFVRRHMVEAITRSGQRFFFPVCIFMTIAEHKIVRIDEYVDSKDAQELATAIAASLENSTTSPSL